MYYMSISGELVMGLFINMRPLLDTAICISMNFQSTNFMIKVLSRLQNLVPVWNTFYLKIHTSADWLKGSSIVFIGLIKVNQVLICENEFNEFNEKFIRQKKLQKQTARLFVLICKLRESYNLKCLWNIGQIVLNCGRIQSSETILITNANLNVVGRNLSLKSFFQRENSRVNSIIEFQVFIITKKKHKWLLVNLNIQRLSYFAYRFSRKVLPLIEFLPIAVAFHAK